MPPKGHPIKTGESAWLGAFPSRQEGGDNTPSLFFDLMLVGVGQCHTLYYAPTKTPMNKRISPTYLADLAEAFEHESSGQNIYLLTKAEICDGSVLLDPRNFSNRSTCRVAVAAGVLQKFNRVCGVQYYNLTEKGFDMLFPNA